jgi:hypothetical protein
MQLDMSSKLSMRFPKKELFGYSDMARRMGWVWVSDANRCRVCVCVCVCVCVDGWVGVRTCRCIIWAGCHDLSVGFEDDPQTLTTGFYQLEEEYPDLHIERSQFKVQQQKAHAGGPQGERGAHKATQWDRALVPWMTRPVVLGSCMSSTTGSSTRR